MCVSTAISVYMDIPANLWLLHFIGHEFLARATKITVKISVSFIYNLTFWFYLIFYLSKNSYNTESMNNCMKVWSNWIKVWSHITEKLSFTNIEGLCVNFVCNKSFIGTYFSDTLNLCKTNFDNSIDSGNFSVKLYLHLI